MNRPAFPPKLTIIDPSIPIPAQVSALTWVGSALGSWFGGAKVYTGAEIDAIRALRSSFPAKLQTDFLQGGRSHSWRTESSPTEEPTDAWCSSPDHRRYETRETYSSTTFASIVRPRSE